MPLQLRSLVAVVALAFVALFASACEQAEPPPPPAPVVWPEGDLVDVALTGAGRAVVVAADGTIHVGRPGKGEFSRAQMPAVEGLTAIAMADAQRGWAVGPGVVLGTQNGGRTWAQQRLPGAARDLRLVAIAPYGRLMAVAIDDRGRVIGTTEAGAAWVRWAGVGDEESGRLDAASSADVVCAPAWGEGTACFATGVAGIPGLARLGPARRGIYPLGFAPPEATQSVGFREGGAEPDGVAIAAVEQAASRWASEPVDWSIDVRVTAVEIESAKTEQDPDVLFDLIEARAEEVAERLEAAGIASERITSIATPPWGYEDQLDDDPRLLDRYWKARLADRPEARVTTNWNAPVDRVALDADQGSILVTGPSAVAFVGAPRRAPARTDGPGAREPIPGIRALVHAGGAWLAAGNDGAVWRGESSGAGLTWTALAKSAPKAPPLHGIAAAGDFAIAVGEEGRMLWSEDAGVSWQALERPGAVDAQSAP